MAIVASIILFILLASIVLTVGVALFLKLSQPNREALVAIRAGRVSGRFLCWNRQTKTYESGPTVSGQDLRRAFPL